ncbi:MAG: nitronate monooxygenase family protein [Eubacteriales bacterium]|nr:nitronate monooxygenase family protein [Eubacteriales bacterium]
MKLLKLGNKVVEIPIIQGGMGVGISSSSLAGAVAAQGAVGIISTAQLGYDEDNFDKNQNKCNLHAIGKHIKKAKEIAGGNGLVGVNVMVALKHFKEHVRTAAEAGADVIICGAGLPMELPQIIDDMDAESRPAIAPIVSSAKAANLVLKMWDRHYSRTADFLVIEGPKAGGHLGFSLEQLDGYKDKALDYDSEIIEIIKVKSFFEEKYGKEIPVIVAGGIFDEEDIRHVIGLGADGVQIASRFVATQECDASDAYKKAYVQAGDEDITIVKSPVGMPGRALNNKFIKDNQLCRKKITKCYNCLEKCNPAKVPYCITEALINAVKGNIDEGLIFCGSNVGRIKEITTVKELVDQLKCAFDDKYPTH